MRAMGALPGRQIVVTDPPGAVVEAALLVSGSRTGVAAESTVHDVVPAHHDVQRLRPDLGAAVRAAQHRSGSAILVDVSPRVP